MLAFACNITARLGNGVVIRWRLAIVMAERDIRNKDLARLTGLHPTSISRLKNEKRFPKIDESTLSALCKALKCQPGDLMVYEEDVPEK